MEQSLVSRVRGVELHHVAAALLGHESGRGGLPDARRARIWGVALMSTVISTVPWALAHERDATRASLVEDLGDVG